MKSKKTKTELKEEFRKIIDEANENAQSFMDLDYESAEYEREYENYVNNLSEKLLSLFEE